MKTLSSNAVTCLVVAAVCAWLAILVTGLSVLETLAPVPVEAQTPNFRDPIVCDQHVVVSGNSAATAQLVALTANQRVRVCGFVFTGAGATTVKLVSGTGVACASGATDVTAPFELGDNTSVSYGNGVGVIAKAAVSEALCWNNAQSVQVSGVVTFAKF